MSLPSVFLFFAAVLLVGRLSVGGIDPQDVIGKHVLIKNNNKHNVSLSSANSRTGKGKEAFLPQSAERLKCLPHFLQPLAYSKSSGSR